MCVTQWLTKLVLSSTYHTALLTRCLLQTLYVTTRTDATESKQTAFSQYDRPQARRRYAEVADHLGPSQVGDRTAQKIERLLTWLEELKVDLDIPLSIQAAVLTSPTSLRN